MPIEIAGFAQALARCLDFETVEPPELEDVLADATEPLEMQYAEASAESPLIRSGTLFTHLLFVQHGTVVPWQYPYSELEAPFLIGEHEFLMDTDRWVASYSAVTEAIVVWIPVALMYLVVDRIPRVRNRMHQLVMRRLARFYWTSLATTGTPSSRVAAALVSRLALDGKDHGEDREISIRHKDLYSPDHDVALRGRGRIIYITESKRDWTGRRPLIKIFRRGLGSRCRPPEGSCVCRSTRQGDPVIARSAG